MAKQPFWAKIIQEDRTTGAPPHSKSSSVGGQPESLGGSGKDTDIDKILNFFLIFFSISSWFFSDFFLKVRRRTLMTYIPVEATNREIEAELINCRVSETLHSLMWDANIYVNYLLIVGGAHGPVVWRIWWAMILRIWRWSPSIIQSNLWILLVAADFDFSVTPTHTSQGQWKMATHLPCLLWSWSTTTLS